MLAFVTYLREAREQVELSPEYRVVHEMPHYVARNHGERFTKLLDEALPDGRSRRGHLNEAPLAEET